MGEKKAMESAVIGVASKSNSTTQNCVKLMKTTSDGAWQGDNPLNYAFPLLVLDRYVLCFLTPDRWL